MKCQTKHCRSKAYKAEKLCLSCRQRKFKERSPFAYHFNALRCNAKRRGKELSLTIEQFTAFAIEHRLIDSQGNKNPRLSIDRIDQARGYHLDNIQVLTVSENSRKRFVDYYRSRMEHMDEQEIQKWQEYEDRLNEEITERRETMVQEDYPDFHETHRPF